MHEALALHTTISGFEAAKLNFDTVDGLKFYTTSIVQS